MQRAIVIVLLFLSFGLKAQVYQAMPQAGYGPVKRFLTDSVLTIPTGINSLRNITGGRDAGQIRWNTTDSSFYVYSGYQWIKINIDSVSLSNRINGKLSISDTATMLSAYMRKTDTLSLSNRIDLRVKYSDTASMLSVYLRKLDTASLSDRINTKQDPITLTTTGISGVSTFISNTLNIPNYGGALTAYVPYSGATTDVTLGARNLTGTLINADYALQVKNGLFGGASNGYTSLTSYNEGFSFFTNWMSGPTTFTKGASFIYPTSGTTFQYLLPIRNGTLALVEDNVSLSNRINAKIGATDTVSLSNRINLKLNASDTASLSNRINLKLNISDTAAMLSPYLQKADTSSLSNRIDLRVKYSDTASMLNPYLRKVDTASLSNRINTKQGIITLTTLGNSGTASFVSNVLNIPNYTPDLTGFVPYVGATTAVNLGAFDLTVNELTIGKGLNALSNNTALGYRSLYHTTTGNFNTSVGYQSGHNITTGQYNTTLGQSAMFTNNTGSLNTAIGVNSLLNNTSGGSNVVLGLDAMQHNTTGNSNTALGYNAGSHLANGTTPNETTSTSVYIGRDTKASASGNANEIVVGYNAIGNGSNTVTIGNSSVTANYLKGSVNAGSFVKSGGTSSQFLKADGSVDSSSYFSDTTSLSNRINLKLNATDTASLSNRINAKADALSGTTNTVPKFTSSTTIGNSNIKDDGNIVTINATAGSFGALQVGNYNGNILMNTTNTSAGLIFQNTSASNKKWDFSSFNNDLSFNESNVDPVMTLQAGGNVGINVTNPSNKLEVNGTFKASDTAFFGSKLSNGTYTYTLPSGTGTLALTSAFDTTSLSNRINTKLNSADTASLSNRINTKLNSSDTASLSNRINDKGSGTVTSIATNLGLTGGTITTSGTLSVDTSSASILSRQRAANTYYLASNPSGYTNNTGTVTSIATGLGLSGGTITTSGTLLVDTSSASILSRERAAATYATTSALSEYLPLTGGTLTGTLAGLTTSSTLYAPLSEAARFPTASQIYLNNSNAAANSFSGISFQVTRPSGTNTNAYIGAISTTLNPEIVFGQRDGSNNLYAERMRITSGGNVLIGTTTDAGYKLDVNGTGKFVGASASPLLDLTNSTGGTKADFTITENTGLIINSYEGASARSIDLRVGGTSALSIASTGAATFSSRLNVNGAVDDGSTALRVAGNLSLTTAGNKLLITTGTNASAGTTAAMTAGTITVTTTAALTGSIILLTAQTTGGTAGALRVSARVNATSFTITSSSALDTSTVGWLIIN